MTDPVLRDLLIESVRQVLDLPADEPLPRTVKSVKRVATLLGISHHKACALAARGELPGQLTRERPFLFSTYGLIQALLGLDGDRVDAPTGSPGLVVQQGSQASNGRREGQLPVRISVPGRESSSSEEPS